MKSEQSGISAEALAESVAQGESAAGIAAMATTAWRQADVRLSPLIGRRGLAALYQRSVHISANTYPWLGMCYQGIQYEMDLESLRAVLAAQSPADAAATTFLLQTIYDLLAGLIGPSLTARLLRPVWNSSSRGASAQDNLP